MTTGRGATRNVVVVTVVILAVTGSILLLTVWMSAPTVPAFMMYDYLRITDVKFGNGYLNVTVRNDMGGASTIVAEVSVNQTRTRVLPFVVDGRNVTVTEILPGINVAVNEPIGKDEQVSITIGYDWTSGYTYQIRVSGGSWFFLNAFAPAPLVSPFRHPFWHRPGFSYEYW